MKLLIVEDEKELLEDLKTRFQEACFSVDTAANGEQGLRLIKTNDYDAVILDNNLPKKTGVQICREAREAGEKTPIIILSILSGTDKKVTLLEAGADDYLTKPFSFRELLARVKALLRRNLQITDDVIEIDELRIDFRRGSVMRENIEIYLTRKEFMLLEYLVRNADTVLSRGMILEHVWNMNADPFSNTIESHIKSLRKKIETEKSKFIVTMPGRGYKLVLKK